MVAKGSRPDGPFTPVNLNADGTKTLPGSVLGFDPSIYVEQITDKNDPDYDIGFRRTVTGASSVRLRLNSILIRCIPSVRARN